MTKDEALKMAIERLEKSNFELNEVGAYTTQIYNEKAINACKEALEPTVAELNDELACEIVQTIRVIDKVLAPCVNKETPKICWRVRCNLGNKCVDDDLSFRNWSE